MTDDGLRGRLGHYGWPALLAAACAVALLVVHLAVPYAAIDHADPESDDETLDRGEAADVHDDLNMAGLSSPGLALAGSIVLLVGAGALALLGFVPMRVPTARLAGWACAVVAVVGALLAFTSAMAWVGSGLGQAPPPLYAEGAPDGPTDEDFEDFLDDMDFAAFQSYAGLTGGVTGYLELALQSDNGGTVHVIQPPIVAALAAAALLAALAVAGRVVAVRDGLRGRAQRHLRGARLALGLLTVVLVVPWSVGELEDERAEEDEDLFLFGAHTVLNAEETSNGRHFGALAYAIGVLVATSWVGVLLGAFGSLGGVLASEGTAPALARGTHAVAFANLFMLLWGGVVYVLAWIYMWRPIEDADGFQPGYAPALALPLLVLWGVVQVRIVRLLAERAGPRLRASERVSFD